MLALLNAGLCAINIGLYAWGGNPISLGAGIFCGLIAIAITIREAKS